MQQLAATRARGTCSAQRACCSRNAPLHYPSCTCTAPTQLEATRPAGHHITLQQRGNMVITQHAAASATMAVVKFYAGGWCGWSAWFRSAKCVSQLHLTRVTPSRKVTARPSLPQRALLQIRDHVHRVLNTTFA
jgi:hypothetical protein